MGANPRRASLSFGCLLAAVLLAAAVFRVLFPQADPPLEYRALNYTITGELFTFEGNAWVQDARNRSLFGCWVMDKWPTSLFMPLHNLVTYMSFATFGVGLWQVRLPSMVMGVLATILLYGATKRWTDPSTGLLAAAMWGVNYLAVSLNRTALIESGLIFMAVATYGLWIYGRKSVPLSFLTGIGAFLCVLYKPTGIIMPVCCGCLLALEAFAGDRQRPLVAFLCGLALAGAVYLTLFHSRLEEILTFYRIIGAAWKPKNITEWVMSTATVLTGRYFFFRQPVLFVLSFIWLGGFLARFATVLKRSSAAGGKRPGLFRHQTDTAEAFIAAWFILGITMPWLEGGQNPMLRRYMMLLPPMVVMSAITLTAMLHHESPLPAASRGWLPLLFLFGYVVSFSLLRMFLFPHIASFGSRESADFYMLFTLAVAGGAFTAAILRWRSVLARHFSVHRPKYAAALMALYTLVQTGQIAYQSLGRSYTIFETNRRLAVIAELQQQAVMAGSTLTITSSFMSAYRPVVVGSPPRYMNWEGILESPEIAYYLINTAPYAEDNPILMQFLTRFPRSVPLAEVQVGLRKATVYRKVAE